MLLEQRILDLQKDKGALIDKVRELKNKVLDLETLIKKMKCCENCKHYNPCVTVNETITNLCEDYYNSCNNSIYELFNKWEVKLTAKQYAMVSDCIERVSANEREFDKDSEEILKEVAEKFKADYKELNKEKAE